MEILKATHQGELNIGEMSIPCAVLTDGTRVLTSRGFLTALKRPWKGSYVSTEMPNFLDANNLKPFISDECMSVLTPVEYKNTRGTKAIGYKAELLPLVCEVYLLARENGAIKTKNQLIVAKQAEILVRSLSKLGIIALIDEASGYQYDREKDELQKILQGYIAAELLPWSRQFPNTFYTEIFRLNGWNFTVGDIKKRPGVVGKWTNKIIYEQLPKGVLEELKAKTPKGPSGSYSAKLHQSLTTDLGHPHLQAQLHTVIGIMRISDNWEQFIRNFNKLKERQSGVIQQELKFEDFNPNN